MVLLYVRSVYPEPSVEWSSGTVLCCSYTKQHYSSYLENNMYVLMSLYLASYQFPVEYRKAQL